jgi:hypothetical protein
MIRANIYIKKYDWVVHCFISVTHYANDEILANLMRIGCRGGVYADAKEKLNRGEINGGLTYTSYRTKQSVMVTSLAESAEEQFNTITHEVAHVCAHIAQECDIPFESEEFAYLVGDFSMALFPKVKDLLCECCRNKKGYYGRLH